MILGPREHVWLCAYMAVLQNPLGYASHEAEVKADAALRAYDRRFPADEPLDAEDDR